MNIVLLTASPINKASGSLAIDLMNGFLQNGHQVVIFTTYCNKEKIESIIEINNKFICLKEKLIRLYNRKVRKYFIQTDKNYYFQDYDLTKSRKYYKKIIKNLPFKPDAFIYLFPQYFLNVQDLYKLNQITGAPILWYMVDMFPITGGCHYAWECKGYENSCGNCPGLYSRNPFDQTYVNWNFKKEFVSKIDIVPIAGSELLFQQLLKSKIFASKKKYKILLGIDNNEFSYVDKKVVRKELNLPLTKKIIFFGAVNINEKRKGLKELLNSLIFLKNDLGEERSKNLHLIFAGNRSEEFISALPLSSTFLGLLSPKQLPKAYQAADLFVSPSIEDSGPMMINQSIMCGTPVVAFEMGVAIDLVITGQTGYRAKLKDSKDLANGIKYVLELNDAEYNEMSENCKKLGLELLDRQKQAEKFIEILKS